MSAENSVAPVSQSGAFEIAGKSVHRLGFGAMRITGPGIWGEPADRAEAWRCCAGRSSWASTSSTPPTPTARTSEEMIAEALHPYAEDVLIATKAGLTRSGPDRWAPVGRPGYLRQQAELSAAPAADGADRAVPAAPDRPRGAAGRSGRRAQGAAGRGQDRRHRAVGGQRLRDQGGPRDRRDRHRAEPLQPDHPELRGCADATARPRASASSRGTRSRPGTWPSPAAPSTTSSRRPGRRPRKSRWPGCWPRRRSPCRSRAPPSSATWRRTSALPACA